MSVVPVSLVDVTSRHVRLRQDSAGEILPLLHNKFFSNTIILALHLNLRGQLKKALASQWFRNRLQRQSD